MTRSTPSTWSVNDADMHVMEPADLWQRYISPAFRHVAPIGMSELERDMRVKVKSRIMLRTGRAQPLDRMPPRPTGWRPGHEDAFALATERGWDATSQLAAMDVEGLDTTVLFPSRGLSVLALDSVRMLGNDGLEGDFAAAIARAYNDWLYDFCKAAPDRLHGAGMLAPHDVPAAVEEARRCVVELGFKALYLNPGCIDRRPWHDAHYDPIWAECERLGVPICFHGGGQAYLRPDFSLEIFDDCMMWHVFAQPLGIMATTLSLCAGGVFERFPGLRAGLLEGNCSWAPWLVHRMDEHFEWLGWFEAPHLSTKPSQHFVDNCFLAVETDEATVADYIARFGDDNLVYSTDYPHGDCKYPHAVEEFMKLPIADTSKRKILGDNYARLYGIPSASAR